jgi:hypothetical protein
MKSEDRKRWLEKFVETFMFHDVEVCINGGANFAAALALNVYTDALGGLINGNLTAKGVSELNYTTFLKRMGYSDAECMKYYENVRCGLAHQYFIKNEFVIGSWQVFEGGKGIREALEVICFVNQTYFDEFKKAYFEYKAELLASKGDLAEKFDRALAGETLPHEVKAYYDLSTVMTSLSAGAISGGALIFVPTAGPMEPVSREGSANADPSS